MSWEALNAAIAEVRVAVAAEARDADMAAEGEAYVARVVTAAMATAFMGHRLVQGGLGLALPVYGGPNPDYIMRHAAIDAGGRYRLTGRLNGSERVGVGLYTVGPNGAPLIAGYCAFDRGNVGPDGSFALELAGDAEGPGAMAIPQGARIVMFRVLHRDASEPAYLDLVGGAPLRGPTLVTGSNDGALAFAARAVRANVAEYMKWVRAAANLPNRLDVAPPELAETVIGDADTQYFLGGFDLGEGEWLEVVLPAGLTGYWSLHAYNAWYEHLVTPGVHDRNAVAGADGTVRIAVGPDVPGDAANRIDTLGRRKGAFVCRIVGHGAAVAAPGAVVRHL
ncbi:MAG: hypothetical protein KGN34_09030 [Sphingomonadales bacterium]|nr:hypothetical protein [Sphingomonadales bacterium]